MIVAVAQSQGDASTTPSPRAPRASSWRHLLHGQRDPPAPRRALCGTYLQQELAIITGACDAMVVDIQCIFQNLANVAKCFHTKLITTHPIARWSRTTWFTSSSTSTTPWKTPKAIVKMAIDNLKTAAPKS
jgi:hypothetical protein